MIKKNDYVPISNRIVDELLCNGSGVGFQRKPNRDDRPVGAPGHRSHGI